MFVLYMIQFIKISNRRFIENMQMLEGFRTWHFKWKKIMHMIKTLWLNHNTSSWVIHINKTYFNFSFLIICLHREVMLYLYLILHTFHVLYMFFLPVGFTFYQSTLFYSDNEVYLNYKNTFFLLSLNLLTLSLINQYLI